jgi:hypothetical protein
MSVNGVNGVGGPGPSTPGSTPVPPSDDGGGDITQSKAFQQVVSGIFQGGQGMMKDALGKFFEEEEPDEDDPDAEPL